MGISTVYGHTPDSDDNNILFVEVLLIGTVVFYR